MALGNDLPQQCDPYNPQIQQKLQVARSVLNSAVDAVFWLAANAQLLYVNNEACRWLEYSREELLCLTMHDLSPDLSAEVWLQQWRSLQQHGYLRFESRYRTKTGQSLPVEISASYESICGQEFICAFARDRSQERELHQALEQEKQRNQIKAQFIDILSHEVRTLLNLISFSISLVKRYSQQWTEEKKRPHLDGIQSVAEQIDCLLDDVLLINKAEAGKLHFEPTRLDLHQFCYELVAQIELMGNSSQHSIAFVSRGNCKLARVDKKLLRPILMNLLNNAIKYSPSGSIVNLEVSCHQNHAVFQIKDTGIGIAVEREQLFEPFCRGSNVGDIPGTGLGLAVVKKLVDLHCGQIMVDSEVGKGTTFTIALPFVNPTERVQPE